MKNILLSKYGNILMKEAVDYAVRACERMPDDGAVHMREPGLEYCQMRMP